MKGHKKFMLGMLNMFGILTVLCSGCGGGEDAGEPVSMGEVAVVQDTVGNTQSGEDLNAAETAADEEWYKNGDVYTDENGRRLEVSYDDEGMLQFAVDGITLFFTSADKFQQENNWKIYTCDDGTVIVYYPGSPAHLEISDGEYAGLYEAGGSASGGISAESLAGCPEFMACAEWLDFLEGYDTDGAILMAMGDDPLDEEYEYKEYMCYSEEMEKKVDEICEKYGLSMLSGCQVVESYDEFCSKAGIGPFCQDSEGITHVTLSGYLYDDGTFCFEGNVTLTGTEVCEVGYQVLRAVKGTFNGYYLDFGDFSEYSMRSYTTKSGENALILCHADILPYIVVERENCFVVVCAYGGLLDVSDVNDERLEMLADAFDFSAIP